MTVTRVTTADKKAETKTAAPTLDQVREILGKLEKGAAEKCLEIKGVQWRLPVEGERPTHHDLHPENYGRVFQRAEIILRKIMEAEAKKPKLITAADVESGAHPTSGTKEL